MTSGKKILSDTWYGAELGADPAGRISSRLSRWVITLRMARQSRRYDAILTSQGNRTIPGVIVLALALRITRQRKLVFTEFLPGTYRRGIRGTITTLAYRWLLDRVCLGIQVMTEWEVDAYAGRYGISPERIRHIPFYWFDDREKVDLIPPDQRTIIMSSGKNSCDWPTVLAALGDRDDLVVVCSTADLAEVSALAGDNVTVRSAIPRAEHDDLLARARLFIVALQETTRSAGHVRLMGAATFGTPVIATSVKGIEGYEQLAVEIVPPADPAALRTAVDRLLADPERLATRAAEVRALAGTRTRTGYLAEIAEFVNDAVDPASAGPGSRPGGTTAGNNEGLSIGQPEHLPIAQPEANPAANLIQPVVRAPSGG